jgi:hypothetical protein
VATLNSHNGVIRDHTGVGHYLPTADCGWFIDPPGTSFSNIVLTFLEFDLDEADVYVYDGDSGVESRLIGAFTGTRTPPRLISTGRTMYITFKSHGSDVRNGFVAVWNTSK